MINTKTTVNKYLRALVASDSNLSGFTFYTGNESISAVPIFVNPCVVIQWLDGDGPGKFLNSRSMMAQIEVRVSDEDEARGDLASQAVMNALVPRKSSSYMATIPKNDYTTNSTGAPLGTNLILETLLKKGWMRLKPPEQASRIYRMTLVVDYIPG